jgi:hypothetical protein
MIEPNMSTEFSDSENQQLSELIGSKLLFVGGKDLPEFLVASQIVISTTKGALVFEGDVVESGFEGYVENYSRIRVHPSPAKEVSNLQIRGNVYFQHAGELIRNVYVVRRVITELKQGVPSWTLATSRAVVLDFGTTQLCLSKLGEHDEALAITDMHGFEIGKVPETSSYFEVDLETGYQVHDEIILLNDPDA